MSELVMPAEPPALDPLKLVTMTISANISQCFNLDVISRYIVLDDTLLGIHYRDIHRGAGTDSTELAATPDESASSAEDVDAKSGRFKNQCTFAISDGNKIINTKLFNNGKMVNVGCKHPDQAVFTAEQIISKITGPIKGSVTYNIPQNLKGKTFKELKKFFKDDLRKKFGSLLPLLVCRLGFTTDLSCFSTDIGADEGFNKFMEKCNGDQGFVKEILHMFTIISILKCYTHEQDLQEHFNTEAFQDLLTAIVEHTNAEATSITYDFPAYLSSSNKHAPNPQISFDSQNPQISFDSQNPQISFDSRTVKIVLINKSTKCGYFINRTELQRVLTQYPEIVQCKFDKSKYPGVLAQYQTTDGKVIKIIVFNTGKINITAASTHEQVQEGYNFIEKICKERFSELLLKCEYQNKKKEYEDSLPDQQYIGTINEQSYYLLNKTRILSNPRNVRWLHNLGIIDKYR